MDGDDDGDDGEMPQVDTESSAFFESKIRPVLVNHCFECHSSASGGAEGGLLLDSREGIVAGGDRGPAIAAGQPSQSRLLRAIKHEESDLHMPPRGKRLPESVLMDFEMWIRRGAFVPASSDIANSRRKGSLSAGDHWAYQPVRPRIAPVANDAWCLTRLDSFVAAQHRKQGLHAANDASNSVLLRRLYFDLVGLPPSPDVIIQFEKGVADHGLEVTLRTTIDDLLQSPYFGERWGRHWLDVARYGESSGKEANITFPYAWRYRDYVIDAFNRDLPFDQFIR
ncbi:MAG: DUF1549 domain-containing protein, partial [Rubripirellula sp.]